MPVQGRALRHVKHSHVLSVGCTRSADLGQGKGKKQSEREHVAADGQEPATSPRRKALFGDNALEALEGIRC